MKNSHWIQGWGALGLSGLLALAMGYPPDAHANAQAIKCGTRKDIRDKLRQNNLVGNFVSDGAWSANWPALARLKFHLGFEFLDIDFGWHIDWQWGPKASISTSFATNYAGIFYDGDGKNISSQYLADGTWANYKLTGSSTMNLEGSIDVCWFNCKRMAWIEAHPKATFRAENLFMGPGATNTTSGRFEVPLSAGISISVNNIPPFSLDARGTGRAWLEDTEFTPTGSGNITVRDCLDVPSKLTTKATGRLRATGHVEATRWFTIADGGFGYVDFGPRVKIDVIKVNATFKPSMWVDFKTWRWGTDDINFLAKVDGPAGGSFYAAIRGCIRTPWPFDDWCADDDWRVANL